jgi:alkylated DNA repair dioxygenase AlkB
MRSHSIARVQPLQATLLGQGEPVLAPAPKFERIALDGTSWVDVARGWLEGADTMLEILVQQVPWRQGRRWMYERMVDDPRLSAWYRAGAALPHPALDEMRDELAHHYRVRFGSVGCNYYRDGRDSVAWHRDRELRELDNTLVAIVTVGGPRAFLLRPRGRGASIDLRPAAGDLLVMGGRCQRDWEHSVPKARAAPPRVSVSLRWSAERGSPS